MIVFQAVVALTLWTYHRAGAWTFDSVGLSRRVSPVVAFAVGVFEFYLFVVLVGACLQVAGASTRYWRAVLRANAQLVPRGRPRQLTAGILIALVNPLTEELFFRGLLVYQFVFIGAPLSVALVAGALVTISNHAYQGWLLAPYHLAFYACAVALLFSPLGIAGAIGFHFGGDAFPLLSYGWQLRRYRSLRRSRRSNSGF
jgi:membrane protease YdiL (CAAX protease family)